MGSYAEEQILPTNRVVPAPSSIDPVVAESVVLKGMTSHYLVRHSFPIQAGHTVLFHASAGGEGSLLCQWTNALGATVIGTVSTEEKAIQAKEDGCHHVIMYKGEDVMTRVNVMTGDLGVEVVYDFVGKDTIQGSFDCLKLGGYLVMYGQSSGTPDPHSIISSGSKVSLLNKAYPRALHCNTRRATRICWRVISKCFFRNSTCSC